MWISKAAEGGVILAARDLGQMYLRGDGVLQDFDMAREWLKKAAYDNDPIAQRELGEIYAQGMGTKKDNVWAYVWFDYPAKNGDKEEEARRAGVVKTMSSNEISRVQDLAESIKDEIFHNALTHLSRRFGKGRCPAWAIEVPPWTVRPLADNRLRPNGASRRGKRFGCRGLRWTSEQGKRPGSDKTLSRRKTALLAGSC